MLRDDTRGLGTGLIGFIAILIIAAILYTMTDPAASQLFDTTSSAASSSTATDAINERQQIWDAMPFFMLFLAMIYFIARAVFESRRPG